MCRHIDYDKVSERRRSAFSLNFYYLCGRYARYRAILNMIIINILCDETMKRL